MPKPETEDIPRFVRRCWDRYMAATEEQREREKESLGFWIGGRHQWRPGEVESRQGANRPWVTINRCKPAVDQVENEARNNPPGPVAHPVGGGADKDGADILVGLIREEEYRSDAKTSYITALRYAAAGGSGCFELATEYAGERTMEQRLVTKEIVDPSTVFYDPEAVQPCREDAMWQGKIRVLTREAMIEQYGSKLKVLNRSALQFAGGWMQDAVGWRGDWATANEWTGGANNQGPYFVCEFYRVIIDRVSLKLWSDNILRFEDEDPPAGVTPKADRDGDVIFRSVPRRKVKKYVVTALDVIEETDWLGSGIPIFWVMGPELYHEHKLYRLSLISGAQDSNRSLNYCATCATEIVGSMTKSPWLGFEGQFDTVNAQGFRPWDSSNSKMWAYLEIKPTWATDPSTGQSVLLPSPTRNTWEAPIQRLMELATFFGEQIKAATSVFFEPSVPSAAQAQSGSAIKALQQQTNMGTINWQDNLHRAVALKYQMEAEIFPRIYDGPRVVTVVRPDNQHETAAINQEFPAHEIDQATGKHRGKDGKLESRNSITLGQYSLRVTAGPDFQTRTEQSVENLTEVFHIAPQLLGAPGVAARFLRMVGEGNPQVEEMADSITPDPSKGSSPEQMGQQLQAAQQQNQALQVLVQKMQTALAAKLPEVEAGKWKVAVQAIAGIREAEIKAGVDKADIDTSHLEQLAGFAHERAMQATEHAHAQTMQDQIAAQQPPPEEQPQQ